MENADSFCRSRVRFRRVPTRLRQRRPLLELFHVCVARAQLVEDEGFEQNRALGHQASTKACPRDERPEDIEVGIRRQQDVQAAAGAKPLARLIEQ